MHDITVTPFASLGEWVDDLARLYPEKPAFKVGGRARTRGEAADRARALASGWSAAGLHAGQTVGIVGEGGPAFVVAFLSAARAGLVPVLLDPRLTAEEMAAVCDCTRPRALALCGGVPPPVPGLRTFSFEADGCAELEAGGPSSSAPALGTDPYRTAVMLVTSGTSGHPRVVALTAHNLSSNICACADAHPCGSDDVFLSLLPATHAFELTTGLIGPLRCGASVVYPESRNPNKLLQLLWSEGVTRVNVVPAILRMIANELRDTTEAPAIVAAMRRQLRSIVCGGAPLARDLAELLVSHGLPLWLGYGLTEASPVVAVGRLDAVPEGSTGRPVPGVDVCIDPGTGELFVRGPSVMPGYVGEPEATAAVLRDGWLHTGDAARIDADGYLFILGRCRDLIVTSAGLKLAPDDVEAAYRSALFAEICAVGVPDAAGGGGDKPHLAIVPRPESGADREAIAREFVRLSAAAGHRRCAGMTVIAQALPRTRTLKLRRDLVRDLVLQSQR